MVSHHSTVLVVMILNAELSRENINTVIVRIVAFVAGSVSGVFSSVGSVFECGECPECRAFGVEYLEFRMYWYTGILGVYLSLSMAASVSHTAAYS